MLTKKFKLHQFQTSSFINFWNVAPDSDLSLYNLLAVLCTTSRYLFVCRGLHMSRQLENWGNLCVETTGYTFYWLKKLNIGEETKIILKN
jgi:hypothetical protein